MNIVKPPAPTGMGDLAIFLEVVRDKDKLKKHLETVQAAHDAAAKQVKLAGGAAKIEKTLGELENMKAAALQFADEKRAEGDRIVFDASREAASIISQAKVDAGAMRDGVIAERNEARALMEDARENDQRVEQRMVAASDREKDLEARAAEIARMEADYAARKASLDAREAKLLDALR